MAISETMRRNDKSSKITPPEGFSTWRSEREGHDKGGGGLCIMYRESLGPHEWKPEVPANLKYVSKERQWLLIEGPEGRLAFLHVYMACQSSSDDGYLKWNDDLYQLLIEETQILRRQNFAVLALGDFNCKVGQMKGMELNTDQINNNTPKFLNFLQNTNLVVINTLPLTKGLFTHFMNGRASVLDYGLIDEDNVSLITSFVIDSNARYACGSDHALLEASINFGPKVSIPWKYNDILQYNFKTNSDFSIFKEHLDNYTAEVSLSQFDNLSTQQMLHQMTKWLNMAGKDSFGIKVPMKKRGRKLPKDILKILKLKNEVEEQYQRAVEERNQEESRKLSSKLNVLKTDLKTAIIKMKLKQRNFKRNQLLKNDPNRKKFWSFLRTKFKKTGTLSGCFDKHGKMVFKQREVEEAIVDHFKKVFHGRNKPPYENSQNKSSKDEIRADEIKVICGDQQARRPDEFESEVCPPMTFTELERLINDLPTGKSSGYDHIPNEFLINSSFHFKQYLLAFYNKIIEEGAVPEELNIGKCVLIHKVMTPSCHRIIELHGQISELHILHIVETIQQMFPMLSVLERPIMGAQNMLNILSQAVLTLILVSR